MKNNVVNYVVKCSCWSKCYLSETDQVTLRGPDSLPAREEQIYPDSKKPLIINRAINSDK